MNCHWNLGSCKNSVGVNIKHYGIMGKSKIRHQLLQAGYADVPKI